MIWLIVLYIVPMLITLWCCYHEFFERQGIVVLSDLGYFLLAFIPILNIVCPIMAAMEWYNIKMDKVIYRRDNERKGGN